MAVIVRGKKIAISEKRQGLEEESWLIGFVRFDWTDYLYFSEIKILNCDWLKCATLNPDWQENNVK